MRHAFNLDGAYDYWAQLMANHEGRLKTWAVYWYASVFARNGLCLHPRQSLVQNIGFDGSGENCGLQTNVNNILPRQMVCICSSQSSVVIEHPAAAIRYQELLRESFNACPDINVRQKFFCEGNMRTLVKKIINKLSFAKYKNNHGDNAVDNPMEAFIQNGYKPWTYGYDAYKWAAIGSALSHEDFSLLPGKPRYGYRIDERIVEYPWFFSRLPQDSGVLLDAGSILNYPQVLAHPKLANKKLFISTLAHEGQAYPERNISYVYEDFRAPCYKEGFFDWICCLSTLEHVGMDNTLHYTFDEEKKECKHNDYITAINALHSCLKPGGTLFLSIPYGTYKNHNWFQVFNATMLDTIINSFSPAKHIETIFQYVDDHWIFSNREQAQNATCFDIHAQKEYDVDFAAFSRGIACLELVK